jgi:hypothetical protein
MNKEQIFDKIDEIYSEHDGGVIYLSEERINQIKEIIEQAINYTRCCTELCDEEQCSYTLNNNSKMCDDCGKVFG